MTEADTCREFVTPKLVEAGWGAAESVIGEQHSFTNGRIIVAGGKVRRGKQRRADYLLYYRRDFPLAVVEAKELGLPEETGVQQVRDYAQMLGLKFAYATSRDESSWRAVLEYFEPAVQFGMTATPLREESRDSYEYFGNPVYTYSLRQGIEDGFLAPYRVHRVIITVDAAGWRPSKDELDRFGREVPDDEYQTKDLERVVALRARTRAMARHLTDFLKGTDRFAKTLIFCVDQEHALGAAANGAKSALQDRLRAIKAEQQVNEQVAKAAQAEGDVLYWPIYNLDIKNPNAKAGLEQADPKDLIASMRGHEAEVMRLLGEIEALVNEVQA